MGEEISIEIMSDTPADAPPVRKMLSADAGYPSRSIDPTLVRDEIDYSMERLPSINLATFLRIKLAP